MPHARTNSVARVDTFSVVTSHSENGSWETFAPLSEQRSPRSGGNAGSSDAQPTEKNRGTHRESVGNPPQGRRVRSLRGRDETLERIESFLRGLRRSEGGILTLEGPEGVGRTSLIDWTCRTAGSMGIGVARASADELLRIVPLMPLYAALGESPPPMEAVTDGSQRLMSSIGHFRSRVEQRLLEHPLVIAVDDVHWSDPGSLLALRTLSVQLRHRPVAWVLGRCVGRGGGAVDRLFDSLHENTTTTAVTLSPLDDGALLELLGDVLEASPSPEVSSLVGLTMGSPRLLVELVRGLLEEGRIRVRGGRAELDTAPTASVLFHDPRAAVPPFPLPRRFRSELERRLSYLSPGAHQLLQVGAVLGSSFSPQVCAEMIGESVAGILPYLREAVDAHVIACGDDEALEFRHELHRRAVLDAIPRAVRGALHREAAEIMLRHPHSTFHGVQHMALGARHGDGDAVTVLGQAARDHVRSAPEISAELALRALELVDPGSEQAADLTNTALQALLRHGPLDRAIDIGNQALERTASGPRRSRIQCALAQAMLLAERCEEARDHVDSLLIDPAPPEDVRLDAHLLRVQSSLAATGADRLDPAEALRGAEHARTGSAAWSTAMSMARWKVGDVEEALTVLSETAGDGEGLLPDATPLRPLLHAELLLAARQTDRTVDLLRSVAEAADSYGWRVPLTCAQALWAEADLVAGRLDHAAERAAEVVRAAQEVGLPSCARRGHGVLAAVATHRGDVGESLAHVARLRPGNTGARFRGLMGRRGGPEFLWHSIRALDADGEQERARELVRTVVEEDGAQRLMLVGGPTVGPWSVRLALHGGDRATARRITTEAGRLADRNPNVRILRVAHDHTRGVLDQDVGLTLRATEAADPWSAALAQEDLAEVVGDRSAAVTCLETAMAAYTSFGAGQDAARVRRRLRELGVRRRHWSSSARPSHGWESLTDTERAVARQVAEGLTNRQVAGRMFLSPHTIGFHLRRIYRKLDIHSRVDLARHVHVNSAAHEDSVR